MYHHRVDICVVVSLPGRKVSDDDVKVSNVVADERLTSVLDVIADERLTSVLDVIADERLAANDFADVKPHGNLDANQDLDGRVFRRIRQKTTRDN